ncbi:phosphatidylserine decarboxylase [Fluviicola sp.]|uniref:phosphatidylserine decarboxylase n=1 Tax=Fluviicola sp. TaxID=1917219 RepID=UPI0031D97678
MANKEKFHPVVEELIVLIKKNKWEKDFETAIKKASSMNVPLLSEVTNLDKYLHWINRFLYWIPSENVQGKNIYDHLCAFYFIVDQEPLLKLQNKIIPHDVAPPLTTLSAWLVKYANAMGEFLDTPESLTPESEKSFYDSPNFNMNEYIRPHGGWKSFNQIFARNFKPGYRPVAAISDQTVIVSPADSTFDGQWEIREDSHVTVKNLHWKVSELLEGSPYKDRFTNGLFMHAFLSPADYHRQHAPVGGKVLEARVIPGQVYLEVEAVPDGNGQNKICPRRTFDAPDNAGYQFAQARGLIVLDTPIGLVAVVPIGMCQVSSVIMTAEEGVTVRKGEELSYFQFGGSDIILLFESASNVSFTAQVGVHYKMGTRIAQAFPVI